MEWTSDLLTPAAIVACLTGVFALLLVCAAVPALLGAWFGIRIERISLGLPPALFRAGVGSIECVVGALPLRSHTKFYGEEGMFGLRVEEWAPNREERDEDDEDEEPEDDELAEADEEPAEPPPADSFVAAHPLRRALVSAAGPAAALVIGFALLGLGRAAGGPRMELAARDAVPSALAASGAGSTWIGMPLVDGWIALPEEIAAGIPEDRRIADPLLWPAKMAQGVARLAVFAAPADGFAGYISWAVLLVRSFEVGPGFCLSMFGLAACLFGVFQLLPLPIFNGGIVLMCLWEWSTGARPSRGFMGAAVLVSLVWLAAIMIQLTVADAGRFG